MTRTCAASSSISVLKNIQPGSMGEEVAQDRSMTVEPRDTERKKGVILTRSSMNIQVLLRGRAHAWCWPRLLLHFKNHLKFSFRVNEKKLFRLII